MAKSSTAAAKSKVAKATKAAKATNSKAAKPIQKSNTVQKNEATAVTSGGKKIYIEACKQVSRFMFFVVRLKNATNHLIYLFWCKNLLTFISSQSSTWWQSHPTKWSVFKTRANAIVKYLSAQGCTSEVEINKDKPGKGNFIVRVEGKDEPVLELVGMKRPFADLKSLDMEDVGKLVMEAL